MIKEHRFERHLVIVSVITFLLATSSTIYDFWAAV